jgi:hypothetical protein
MEILVAQICTILIKVGGRFELLRSPKISKLYLNIDIFYAEGLMETQEVTKSTD